MDVGLLNPDSCRQSQLKFEPGYSPNGSIYHGGISKMTNYDTQSKTGEDTTSCSPEKQMMQIANPETPRIDTTKKKFAHLKRLKTVMAKAKALGYIGYHQIRNKDNSAWT